MSTTNAVQPRALPGTSPAASKTLVAEWIAGGREVCLFQMSDHLAFSTEGRKGKTTTFNPMLYDVAYATTLIRMFHHTIAMNLEKEEPHLSCFLPKFFSKARNEPRMQVALFGRIDTRASINGELKGLRWGVFDTSNREEQVFEVNDALSEEFVRNAPGTNMPHLMLKGESTLDANKQPIMIPTKNHYAMTTYAKRFDVVLNRDITGVIQNVRLVRTSIFDKNVVLDKHSWAVTLVSLKNGTPRQCVNRTNFRLGHAMIAYEGVEKKDSNMRQFLNYIHITTIEDGQGSPWLRTIRSWLQAIIGGPARVEICDDKEYPHWKFEMLTGPTWPRPNTVVKQMISSALKTGNIDFAIVGTRENPIITSVGGSSVLGMAGLAMSHFDHSTQAAHTAFHESLQAIATTTGEHLPGVTGAEVINETFNRTVASARDTALASAVLTLGLAYLIYEMAKSRSNRQNCADWSIRTVSRAGINIRDIPNSALTPNEVIMYLRSNPSSVELVQGL